MISACGIAELLCEVRHHRLEHARIDRSSSRGYPCI
jgi:hypothetical protein